MNKQVIERLENIIYLYNRESRGWYDCNDIRLNSNDIKAIEKAIELIKAIPSAEPKKCKDCKWWKDSDGVFRRGIGAESQCPMNRIEVYEGNGYCHMFEPQESEE